MHRLYHLQYLLPKYTENFIFDSRLSIKRQKSKLLPSSHCYSLLHPPDFCHPLSFRCEAVPPVTQCHDLGAGCCAQRSIIETNSIDPAGAMRFCARIFRDSSKTFGDLSPRPDTAATDYLRTLSSSPFRQRRRNDVALSECVRIGLGVRSCAFSNSEDM